jgi:hypothetical protein
MRSAQPPRRTGSQAPDTERDLDRIDLAVTRVQTPRAAPRLAAAMWVATAFVVIAVLKPWGGSAPAAPAPQQDVVVETVVTPAPTADRSAIGLAVAACLGTGAWRVASLETWRNRDVRVWRAIEPLAGATGLDDPEIPSVPVVADQLSGLGFCAPAFGPDMPIGPARIQAWQVVDPTGANPIANPIALRQVQPVGGTTPIAALYVPRSGPWTSGRVIFRYEDAGAGTTRWFAVELQVVSPAPTAPALPTEPASTTVTPG